MQSETTGRGTAEHYHTSAFHLLSFGCTWRYLWYDVLPYAVGSIETKLMELRLKCFAKSNVYA
uniref:Uncharacterized protein n=1 Tax=viral metagenome TaxID=1070528 RepID=A0A6C0BZR5_9ZZZZ